MPYDATLLTRKLNTGGLTEAELLKVRIEALRSKIKSKLTDYDIGRMDDRILESKLRPHCVAVIRKLVVFKFAARIFLGAIRGIDRSGMGKSRINCSCSGNHLHHASGLVVKANHSIAPLFRRSFVVTLGDVVRERCHRQHPARLHVKNNAPSRAGAELGHSGLELLLHDLLNCMVYRQINIRARNWRNLLLYLIADYPTATIFLASDLARDARERLVVARLNPVHAGALAIYTAQHMAEALAFVMAADISVANDNSAHQSAIGKNVVCTLVVSYSKKLITRGIILHHIKKLRARKLQNISDSSSLRTYGARFFRSLGANNHLRHCHWI